MLGIAPNFILIMEDLGASPLMMGWLVAAFILGYVIFGGLLLFKASEFFAADVRQVVAIGTGVIAVSGLLIGISPNYWIMWVFRFLTGFGGIMLTVSLTPLAMSWFPEKLNLVNTMGVVSLIVGSLVGSFFGSLIASMVGGWRGMHLVFGVVGLLAFILWLRLGKAMPADGGERNPSPSPTIKALTNGYVWCSAGMLYMLLCFIGAFSFVFIALAGRWDVALLSKSMIFSIPYCASALLTATLVILGGWIGIWLLTKTGRRKPFSVIPGFSAPIAGLVLFSLTFSGIWIAVIIELVALVLFLLIMVVATWLTQIQELPGVGFDVLFYALGAILLIGGTAATIVPVAIGWALAQGWATFKLALYLCVLTWSICGLGGLLIPEPE